MSVRRAEALKALQAAASTLGTDVETVLGALQMEVDGPTVRQFVESVRGATSQGASKTYESYWSAFVTAYGDRSVASIKASEVSDFCKKAPRRAVQRKNGRNGVVAHENCVAALRAFFRVAVEDGVVATNVAATVDKPRRPRSNRRALTADQMDDLYQVCLLGHDPELDTLLLRFHLETGARRGGAIALTKKGLDRTSQCVLLCEKGNTERWQPVSKSLMDALLEHGRTRGMKHANDAVFRMLPRKGLAGRPLTRRHFDSLARRWQQHLEWAGTLGVSIHWVRHTAITNVERVAGFGVAREFAGHFASTSATTTTYITASLAEVAHVVAELTGEAHPLDTRA